MSDFQPASAATAPSDVGVVVIQSRSGWRMLNVRELWDYRELLWVLAARDIKIRYRQAVLGGLWAVLQPIMTMLVLWMIFGRLAQVPSDGYPYPLFVFSALLPWFLFANTVSSSTNSLIGSATLITKVYFPRLLIPLSPIGGGLVDFAISAVALLFLSVGFGISPSSATLMIIPLLVGLIVLIVGLGALLSALTAAYRDFRLVVPFVLQIWFFATPVVYSASLIPAQFRWMLFLNPMSGFVEGFRSAFLGGAFDWVGIGISFVVSVGIAAAGVAYFVRVERRLVDVI